MFPIDHASVANDNFLDSTASFADIGYGTSPSTAGGAQQSVMMVDSRNLPRFQPPPPQSSSLVQQQQQLEQLQQWPQAAYGGLYAGAAGAGCGGAVSPNGGPWVAGMPGQVSAWPFGDRNAEAGNGAGAAAVDAAAAAGWAHYHYPYYTWYNAGYNESGSNGSSLQNGAERMQAPEVPLSLYSTYNRGEAMSQPGYAEAMRNGVFEGPFAAASVGAAHSTCWNGNGAGNRPARPTLMTDSGVKQTAGDGKTRTRDKYRVVYTEYQRNTLENAFNLSERQIKIWFQNRRAKDRKHLKKPARASTAAAPLCRMP